jgi:hypothetical protein
MLSFTRTAERTLLHFALSSLCLCVSVVSPLHANPPVASYIFPAGGRRGTTVPVRVGGLYLYRSCGFELLGPGVQASQQLWSMRTVWFEGPLLPLPASQQPEDYPRDMAGEIRIAADAPLGTRHARLWTAEGAAGGLRFVVGELPEVVEEEIDGDPILVNVTLPVTINGRISPREDVDIWAFEARKGQHITAEVCAAKLGSPLDSHLEVYDPQGRKIAENDDAADADSRLRFTATEDGKYRLHIRDVNQQGGPAFVYRLTVRAGDDPEPAPPRLASEGADFELHLQTNGPPRSGIAADAVTLPRGGQAKLHVVAQRKGGFTGPIALRVAGLPAGVTASNTVLAAGQTATDITLTTTAFAAIGTSHLKIEGSAKVGGRSLTHTASVAGEPALNSVLLAVALRPPFKVVGSYDLRLAPRGSVFRRHYKIERNGFTGPLEVRLADRQARHLQGVTGPTITVPPDATEFDYAVQLPAWMETGRTSRSCILAIGVVREGEHEYTVGYSSEQQNEQIIAVVETGRLGLDTDRQSLAAAPGGQATLAVRISRGKGLTGPVQLELIQPGHMRGVSAQPVVVPADQSRAAFTLHFASGPLGPFNMPVVLRATLPGAAGPAVAETKLELVAEK